MGTGHINVSVQCQGDPLTAITETINLAKAYNGDLYLEFGTFSITVRANSNPLDLIEIYRLNKANKK